MEYWLVFLKCHLNPEFQLLQKGTDFDKKKSLHVTCTEIYSFYAVYVVANIAYY